MLGDSETADTAETGPAEVTRGVPSHPEEPAATYPTPAQHPTPAAQRATDANIATLIRHADQAVRFVGVVGQEWHLLVTGDAATLQPRTDKLRELLDEIVALSATASGEAVEAVYLAQQRGLIEPAEAKAYCAAVNATAVFPPP